MAHDIVYWNEWNLQFFGDAHHFVKQLSIALKTLNTVDSSENLYEFIIHIFNMKSLL